MVTVTCCAVVMANRSRGMVRTAMWLNLVCKGVVGAVVVLVVAFLCTFPKQF